MYIIAAANKRLDIHLSKKRSKHINKTHPHKVHIFEDNTRPTVVIKQKRIGYNSGTTSQQIVTEIFLLKCNNVNITMSYLLRKV